MRTVETKFAAAALTLLLVACATSADDDDSVASSDTSGDNGGSGHLITSPGGGSTSDNAGSGAGGSASTGPGGTTLSGSSSSGNPSSSGGTSSGPSNGGSDTPNTGGSAGSSGAAGSAGGTTTAQQGGGGGTPSNPTCDSAAPYPSGPYGTSAGAILDPSLAWQGFPEGAKASTDVKKICPSDFYDPDGKKGVRALALGVGAIWCGSCQETESAFADAVDNGGKYQGKGVHYVELLIEGGAQGTPANIDDAWSSYSQHVLGRTIPMTVFDNAAHALQMPGGIPQVVIVDPRTMKITAMPGGGGGSVSSYITDLLSKNQ
jgi:hypothetical protein